MDTLFRFRPSCLILTILLFGIEVCIAVFVRDKIIRPYIGDLLVVILLYCFFRSFLNLSPLKTAAGVLLLACAIEALQYFHLVERLGLSHSRIARTVLGSAFEWMDLLAYIAGLLLTLLTERYAGVRRLN